MAIVDQFGRPAYGGHNFFKGAKRGSTDRPWEPVDLRNINQLLPAWDHAVILSASRRIFANSDVVKGACNQKATWSVGRYYQPKFTGADTAWGRQAEQWLAEKWFPTCDLRGGPFDWTTNLYLDSVALDRDGEVLVLLTETESGWPQLQHISATRIGQRTLAENARVPDGPYKGLRMCKGVITNDFGRAVAYQILGDMPEDDQTVSARDLRHIYDPQWHEQLRGIPSGAATLNKIRDAMTSHEWEQISLLHMSSISLIEKNSFGGPDPNDPKNALTGDLTGGTSGVTSENVQGGQVRYFKSGDGSGIEAIDSHRPGDAWDRFQDRIIRGYLCEMDWPFALAWKPEGMNSVIQHSELMKAEKSVQDRQSVLDPHAKAICGWACVKAMQIGELPESDEWYRWDFSKPPRISVSFAKDGRELRASYLEGHITETQLQAWQGRDIEQHYRERARDVAMKKRIAREVSDETGEEITATDMGMSGPNDLPTREEETE